MHIPFKLTLTLMVAITLAIIAHNFIQTPKEERFTVIKTHYMQTEITNEDVKK